jgi:carbon monoxide dehydrogenase subunit G
VQFADRVVLRAPAAVVWDCLLDPRTLAACIPGAEEVTQLDDRTFSAAIQASVGPISGQFAFRAQLVDCRPPSQLTARVEGVDSVTRSTVHSDTVLTLEPQGPDETALHYQATVQIHGRLAILGEMVLRTTAALLLAECARRLQEQVAARARDANAPHRAYPKPYGPYSAPPP